MDRRMLEAHFALAREHVLTGERNLERQREVVVDLDRAGRDTAEARRLLMNFEDVQEMHVADRNRLLSELAAATDGTK